jgi:hypothetical protein
MQVAHAAAQLAALARHHMAGQVAVGPRGVARDRHRLRHVEHDGHGQHVLVLGELDELGARPRLHVGGVHDREQAAPQPRTDDVVQEVEGVGGGRLVVLVVGDDRAAVVRGDHLGRPEMPAGEVRLARPGHADQDDEARLGDPQLGHRMNTPIWVGAPTSGSSSPTGT